MSKKVLYAVLNWGLGHASRSIPIIKQLIQQKHEVVLASDGEALVLLKNEFPKLKYESLTPYNVSYSKTAKDFDKTIFFQLVKLGNAIKKENQETELLVRKHQITHIISDNRYGVYSRDLPSVIVCHQMTLQHKKTFSKNLINKVHFKLLNKFNAIWVPDYANEKCLAGEISKTNNKKLQNKLEYIGPLSRFEISKVENKYDFAVVLSGPEPQRTILEEKLLSQIKTTKFKVAFVRGVSKHLKKIETNKNVDLFNLLNSKELNDLLLKSKSIVCRAGYSSIMDLISLQKPAIIIPTPGQTEQEYLASFLANRNLFLTKNQDDISLESDILLLESKCCSNQSFDTISLENSLTQFLK